MSQYDYLKRVADQATANGQKPFSATDYASANAQQRNHMDKIANS
jgi:hypothetical protein